MQTFQVIVKHNGVVILDRTLQAPDSGRAADYALDELLSPLESEFDVEVIEVEL